MNTLTFCKEKLSGMLSRRGEKIDRSLAISEASYVVVDTELTGLNPANDSIVSIGGIKMRGSRIDLGKQFYSLVKPDTTMRAESVIIHGITPSEVKDEPLIDKMIEKFFEFCDGHIVVGHFISIDLQFLNKVVKRRYGCPLENVVVDTSVLHEWIMQHNGDSFRRFGNATGKKDLFSLAKKYKVPVSEAHNALMDAFVTAQLFQKFLSYLPVLGVRNVRDLVRVGKP